MYTTPQIILNSGTGKHLFDYEWNGRIAVDLAGEGIYNQYQHLQEGIQKEINLCSYKASLSLTTAVMEWILYLFENKADISDAELRLNALRAGSVDRFYIKTLVFDGDYSNDVIQGPLWVLLQLTERISRRYVNQWIEMRDFLFHFIVLAKHIYKKNKVFENWLSDALQKTAETFPWKTNEEDPKAAKYDASNDPLVPRNFFFDACFKYDEASAKQEINDFLQGLDFNKNPYLRTPEEMMAKGFKGTPYQIL